MVDNYQEPRIELMGAPGSPYTRKMLAWLRFKRIPYAIDWLRKREREGSLSPKVRLLPTFYLPDENGELEAVVDSTPIIKRLETRFPDRSTRPSNPLLAFYSDLIEDYADEWLTKIMFHYRWAFAQDAANAGPLLVYFSNIQADRDSARSFAEQISKRQIDRLYVVGSNEITAPTIEASYLRVIDILDEQIRRNGYLLGARPSSADFAAFGQFTQLAGVEPTPAAILAERSPRLRAWLYRVEDLCGLEVAQEDWLKPDVATSDLQTLFTEIGRTYVPVMLANSKAISRGERNFETEVDGQRWVQPTFTYQARCLQWLRETFSRLDTEQRNALRANLADTGCLDLFA